MSGETNLNKLLQSMEPRHNKGEFVYSTVKTMHHALTLNPLCVFQEDESVTVILSKQKADEASLPYTVIMAWITLTVHSSLEAVGLTAIVSKALAEAGISCNIVAAYYHDHIFVPAKDVEQAMNALISLSKQENP